MTENSSTPENFTDRLITVYTELSCEICVILKDSNKSGASEEDIAESIAFHAVQKFKIALKEYIER